MGTRPNIGNIINTQAHLLDSYIDGVLDIIRRNVYLYLAIMMMMGILKILNRILNLRDLFWFCFARIIVQPQLWAQRLSVYSIIVWAGAGNTQPMVAKKSVSSIVQWLVFHYSRSLSICLLADTQQVELHTIHRFSQSRRRPLLGPSPG